MAAYERKARLDLSDGKGEFGARPSGDSDIVDIEATLNQSCRTPDLYHPDTPHERRPTFVLRAEELGFSLEEIRKLLSLVDERYQPVPRQAPSPAAHLDDVRAKIADLKRMERVLNDVVALCPDGTRPECPLIEALFRAHMAAH